MAQFIDIIRVVVGTEYFTATVQISEDAPLMTSEDLEGTTRVYNLLPTIINHACVGDAGSTFKDCMGDTELAHLLEHVTVELLARTNMVEQIVAGRTWRELAYDRTYSIQLDCVDDVLVAGVFPAPCGLLRGRLRAVPALCPTWMPRWRDLCNWLTRCQRFRRKTGRRVRCKRTAGTAIPTPIRTTTGMTAKTAMGMRGPKKNTGTTKSTIAVPVCRARLFSTWKGACGFQASPVTASTSAHNRADFFKLF